MHLLLISPGPPQTGTPTLLTRTDYVYDAEGRLEEILRDGATVLKSVPFGSWNEFRILRPPGNAPIPPPAS